MSFNLTNTTSLPQTVSVSIGSGSVSQSSIVVPSGACATPTTINYSAPSSTTITFTYAGQTIASQPVSSTTNSIGTVPTRPSGPATMNNVSQSDLASVSAAINLIEQEIQKLLGH